MRFEVKILLSTIAALIVTGCNDAKKAEKPPADVSAANSAKPNEQATVAKSAAPPAPQAIVDPMRGTVKETMDAGSYTYVLLDTSQGDVWAAARRFPAVVGAEVEIAGISTMRDFHSPSLNRTFKEIQFVSGAKVIGGDSQTAESDLSTTGQALPPGHPPIGGSAHASPSAGAAGDATAVMVEPLEGGVTVADLFDKRADLTGTVVKFRGRVVKANQGIMGRNWMHLQDGTGKSGSLDITVTSKEGYAPVGSVVTVEGTLALNRDFGAGYTYEVIIEEAKIEQ